MVEQRDVVVRSTLEARTACDFANCDTEVASEGL